MFWGKYRECRQSFRFAGVLENFRKTAFALKEIFKMFHHSSLFVWVLSESWRHSRAYLTEMRLRENVKGWIIFFLREGVGWRLGYILGHQLCFTPLLGSVCIIFWWVLACVKKKIQTQYLNSRKHLLDFSFPMVLLARFFFSSLCQAGITFGKFLNAPPPKQ